jgi:hypothetical protein
MPFPRVTPGLLEVNAAGIEMKLSFYNSKIFAGHFQMKVHSFISEAWVGLEFKTKRKYIFKE